MAILRGAFQDLIRERCIRLRTLSERPWHFMETIRTALPGLDTLFAMLYTRLLLAESSVVCSMGVCGYLDYCAVLLKSRPCAYRAVDELARHVCAGRVCLVAIR